MTTHYAIVYGADGADFPDVYEDGPYADVSAALAAIDTALVAQYQGAMIVSDWSPSDGCSITTGTGRVVRVIA